MRRCPRTAGAAFYSIGSFNFICLYPSVILQPRNAVCLRLHTLSCIRIPTLSFLLQSVVVCNAALVPKESELPCFPLIQDKTFIAGTGQPPKCSWLAAGDGNTWVCKRSPSQSIAFNLNLYSRFESWSSSISIVCD